MFLMEVRVSMYCCRGGGREDAVGLVHICVVSLTWLRLCFRSIADRYIRAVRLESPSVFRSGAVETIVRLDTGRKMLLLQRRYMYLWNVAARSLGQLRQCC